MPESRFLGRTSLVTCLLIALIVGSRRNLRYLRLDSFRRGCSLAANCRRFGHGLFWLGSRFSSRLARRRRSRLVGRFVSTSKFCPRILPLHCRGQSERFPLRGFALFVCSRHPVWDRARLDPWTAFPLRDTKIRRVECHRSCG